MLKCGLLGERLGHSYSPAIHRLLGDYAYALYEVPPDGLGAFLRSGDFDGLNVTIPYKKAVLPFCRELSDAAKSVGAVNTLLRRPDGSLFGDNTDVFGFSWMLRETGTDVRGKKALVFGSGGASLTAQWVLRSMGAEVTVISRTGAENYGTLARHRDAQLLVNATPLGMFPHISGLAADPEAFPGCELVLDMVYNPHRTALLLRAEELGIPCAGGLTMLAAQAVRASELFTGRRIDPARIPAVTRSIRRQTENLVLIGMPGSGKTTVGRRLAERLGRPFFDADAEIERESGRTVPELLSREGEASFRQRETAVLERLGMLSSAVIATGGGAVTRAENYPHLHRNGTLIRLVRELSQLPTEGRPLSREKSPSQLAAEREAAYQSFADIEIDNNGAPEETVERILEAWK